MVDGTRASIYQDSWNEKSIGDYESHSITVAVDNKCFFSFPLKNIRCDYLEKVYAGLAQRIFKIDPTIKPREVSFAHNFDDILIEYDSDNFSLGLERIFSHKLSELQRVV